MRYQLVIQFQATSVDEFDCLIAFEESLTEWLRDSAVVDGHDFGTGEFNIFALTDAPAIAFERLQSFRSALPVNRMRVAYRELQGESFVILWPPNLKQFNVA